jgi:D-alanyl-D-alanine dipeptidase
MIRPVTRVIGILLALLALVLPASAQPVERGDFHAPDLCELTRLDSTLRLDIRYATTRNFMHRAMYDQARAFLQRPAAQALLRVHRKLRPHGYGLLIFDGYRPWSVTKMFWDETPADKHGFVADPQKGSRHNRGCAVDLSIIDLHTGREVTMPSPYDDFTTKASPRYRGGTQAQRARRDILRRTMESEGFIVDPAEWWHYDYCDWKQYRILNVPFRELPN